ncbi:MAG: hypothetical protein IT379_37240, partial [Deltaproteobacteria bacterium]|nr:hypothetical protein [Deltaproteobacteria bacterium]
MTVGAGRTSADPRRTKLRTALGMRLEALADYRLARVRGVRAGEADALEAEHGGLASVEARERLCEIRDSGGELD